MNWFIIRDQDHLGPFTEEDLDELYCSREINDSTLVWNEELSTPIPYTRINPNEPPALPVELINTADKSMLIAPKETADSAGVGELVEDLPEFVGAEDLSTEDELIFEDEEILEDEEIFEDEEILESTLGQKVSLRSDKFKFIGFVILVLIVCVTSFVIYFTSHSNFSRPAKMSLNDYDRLMDTIQDKSDTTKFAFAVAQDRSKVWIATNNPYQGRVAIKFKALKNKFLGEGEIEAFTFGNLNKHLIVINNFKFNKGVKLLDGYYEVELYTPTKLNKPFLDFVGQYKNQFQSFQKVLVSTMKPNVFDKTLAKYSSKKNTNESQFWEELKQKYQTLKMITLQIQDGIKVVFMDHGNHQEKIKSFEDEYKNKYGNFFTNFVITNEASYEGLLNKTFPDKVDIISNYTRLSKLARLIGVEAVKAMDKLRSFKNWEDPKKVKILKKNLLKAFQNIIDVCNYKIGIIQTH